MTCTTVQFSASALRLVDHPVTCNNGSSFGSGVVIFASKWCVTTYWPVEKSQCATASTHDWTAQSIIVLGPGRDGHLNCVKRTIRVHSISQRHFHIIIIDIVVEMEFMDGIYCKLPQSLEKRSFHDPPCGSPRNAPCCIYLFRNFSRSVVTKVIRRTSSALQTLFSWILIISAD